MTKNIKDESLFVYCPTCGHEACCVQEREGSDIEPEEVLYFHCGNNECPSCDMDIEPSQEWWNRRHKEEQAIHAELARLFEKDQKEFFDSIKNKSPEQIEKDNWPKVEYVGMDANVTAEVRQVCEGFDC